MIWQKTINTKSNITFLAVRERFTLKLRILATPLFVTFDNYVICLIESYIIIWRSYKRSSVCSLMFYGSPKVRRTNVSFEIKWDMNWLQRDTSRLISKVSGLKALNQYTLDRRRATVQVLGFLLKRNWWVWGTGETWTGYNAIQVTQYRKSRA